MLEVFTDALHFLLLNLHELSLILLFFLLLRVLRAVLPEGV